MQFHLSKHAAVDRTLLAGAFIFGIGWGLAGFCPGPAVTALAWGSPDAAIFVAAMAAGMALTYAWRARASTPPARRAARPAPRRRRGPNA